MMNASKQEDAFMPGVPVVEEILEIVEDEDDTVEAAPALMPTSAAGVTPREEISASRAASTFEQQSGPKKEAPKPRRFLPGLLAGMLGAAVFFAAVGFVFANVLVAVGEALGTTDALVALGKVRPSRWACARRSS